MAGGLRRLLGRWLELAATVSAGALLALVVAPPALQLLAVGKDAGREVDADTGRQILGDEDGTLGGVGLSCGEELGALGRPLGEASLQAGFQEPDGRRQGHRRGGILTGGGRY